jgi:hypothetical protein
MNNQFKRMQKLAGLITEGEAAYEYEKGKEAGEKTEKKKMKKSELKKQIKEMILAEIDIDLSNDDNFYDPVYEAKKKKKDEEEETEDVTIDDVEIDADEMDMGAEMPAAPAASDVQKELMDALEAAKASGDEKLVRQIGNALTYFTRSQVSKDENPPSMNEEISMEAIDRLEGLANMQDLAVLKAKLRILSSDWMQDGFEKEDIIEYITELINQI